MEIKPENAFILNGFIEENWDLFLSYLEEHSEDEEKAEEILSGLGE